MPQANFTVNLNGRINTSTSIALGQFAVPEIGTGLWLPATTANRGTRRSSMIALNGASAANPGFIGQGVGDVPTSITGLAAGSASWVRVSSTGFAERCTPTTGDDIVGWCEADGLLHLACAILTADIVNGGGGGGGAPSGPAGGDLGGTYPNPDVAAINATTITTAGGALSTGAVLRVTGAASADWGPLDLADADAVTGALPAANQDDQALGGDLSNFTSNAVVHSVNGATVPLAGALTTGTVLRATGAAALGYGAVDLANANAVTGTLPAGNQAAQTMAGDVTGNTGASVVARANGATVPAAGALTTGNVLRVNGASALTYAAVNLAGGANHVTGTLPTGNQASQTMGGNCSGTTASCTVTAINGTTVPAGGALTTGTVLRATGASASAWGAVDLTNANAVTGALPVNRGGTNRSGLGTALQVLRVNAGATDTEWATPSGGSVPTGTGFTHITAGAQDAAAKLVVNADVDAAAAIAGSKVAPNFVAQQIETTGIGLFGRIKTTCKVEAGAGPFDNYDPGDNTVILFTNGALVSLYGIVAPSGGKSQILFLRSVNQVACFNEQATSSAANRLVITTLDGSGVYGQILVYDTTISRWCQMTYPLS